MMTSNCKEICSFLETLLKVAVKEEFHETHVSLSWKITQDGEYTGEIVSRLPLLELKLIHK